MKNKSWDKKPTKRSIVNDHARMNKMKTDDFVSYYRAKNLLLGREYKINNYTIIDEDIIINGDLHIN